MAGRYATALFDLALEQGALERVEGDLKTISSLIDESDDLRRLIRSPVFSAGEQAGAMSAVLQRAGVSELVMNFVSLVTKNRRLFALGDMVRAFHALATKHRGELSAEVFSAAPLNDQQINQLQASLRQSMGREVKVRTSVDPSLLGGLIVKVGSRMIDSSLRTKLNNLRIAMKEVG